MSFNHVTVLLHETVDQLNVRPAGTYVDCTAGGGGHCKVILNSLSDSGRLIAFDRDPNAIKHLENIFADEVRQNKLVIVNKPFSELRPSLENLGIFKVDGICADIGVSSPQIDQANRGFSFMKDGPLDMRMDQTSDQPSAEYIVNNASKHELIEIFKNLGEEPKARFIVDAICTVREQKKIETTLELAEIVKSSVFYQKKSKKHPATKVFQALRIKVNDELGQLEALLKDAVDLLSPTGRLAIITFHSLEDRLVKHTMQEYAGKVRQKYVPKQIQQLTPETDDHKTVKVIKPFPIIPSKIESDNNPRARSAKLRVCEKI